ncbi:MAG: hypothetical protein ACP5IZ_05975 [Thermoprotei archaeon]|jgi:bifunctional DNA-binding transcriptional regulator/antitoxin component of YhaV-PrlF toxin-antitoxin module
MAIVSVDERGRMTIPKEMSIRGCKAVVISAGVFLVVIPLPTKPHEYASSWLPTQRSRKELKILAEKSASEDALKRMERRNRLDD